MIHTFTSFFPHSKVSCSALLHSVLSLQQAIGSPLPLGSETQPSLASRALGASSLAILRQAEATTSQLTGSSMSPWHQSALQHAQHHTRLFTLSASRMSHVDLDLPAEEATSSSCPPSSHPSRPSYPAEAVAAAESASDSV